MFPKGWRNGDWMCSCGFHNYSSRAQCKKCYASVPSAAPSSVANAAVSDMFPALGTKRLASDEFGNDWDSKRLNAGDINSQFMTNGPQLYHGFEQMASSSNGQISGIQAPFSNGSFVTAPNIPMAMPVPVQAPQLPGVPTLLGKGAKQWRDGDWMCTNCNNHNFASRLQCNRYIPTFPRHSLISSF
ncbi:uncharacterized protein LOC18436532 [Amborella trichopoda]|nr:uncharacterized protein LOC18436532 [Amborella trichopoda]|eukprot:XP_006846750.3 uncharacterized protein LOC18436532 [Amborella trichopoda]